MRRVFWVLLDAIKMLDDGTMKNVFHIIFILLMPVLGIAKNHRAEVVLRVVEESGSVVSNAEVFVSFEQDNRGGISVEQMGSSDINGVYVAKEKTSGYIFIRVRKDGYYETVQRLKWHHEQQRNGSFPLSGTTIDVVLRSIKNPIPILSKRILTQIPKRDQEYGYDFEIGDWIAPLGKGKSADVYFKVEGYWKGSLNNDATLTMRFHNPYDGLVYFRQEVAGSVLHSPYLAASDGYAQEKSWREKSGSKPSSYWSG